MEPRSGGMAVGWSALLGTSMTRRMSLKPLDDAWHVLLKVARVREIEQAGTR
jgi:hypothetical protein